MSLFCSPPSVDIFNISPGFRGQPLLSEFTIEIEFYYENNKINDWNFTIKIVKFYTLFNTEDLVFSSTYLTCISQIRESHPPSPPLPTSKHAPLFSLELVLEQKHYDPITDNIRITPFFTAEIRIWKIIT